MLVGWWVSVHEAFDLTVSAARRWSVPRIRVATMSLDAAVRAPTRATAAGMPKASK